MVLKLILNIHIITFKISSWPACVSCWFPQERKLQCQLVEMIAQPVTSLPSQFALR